MQRHEAFTEWAQARGVEIGKVKPARLPGRGLGLVTTASVKKNQRILFVPEKAMFKPDSALLKQHNLQHASPQAQLAVSVLAACATQVSAIALWEATWPTDTDFEQGMPMRWDGCLQDLLPPSVQQPLQRQQDDYMKDVGSVHTFLRHARVTEQRFRYYWSIVNSRSFHWKPPKGKAGSMVMCPFIDYTNHGPTGTGCNVSQRSNGYEMLANRDYDAGEEVLFTYGAHSNDKLLVHYGFICESPPGLRNKDDDIRLDHLLIPKLDSHVRDKLQDVGFLGAYALLPAENELCFKTQVAVRAALLTSNEWEYFVTNGEDMTEDQTPAVLRFMHPLLVRYHNDATGELTIIEEQIVDGSGPSTQLLLLRSRWRQIQDALEAFLKM
ncbi:hypothetical protein BAUCODRAFT_67154 [Baudoinia panamericana UAMH 10762]|uniref:SET domain-containing protein n=1 Tax=Baudoinia panamericana (strain UAMH 10762) TaxID=717646 RepID=M2LU31_BAUPA|nr:uncharacterized protein BAUCODRAFT_67154 [Baudoinia panamericana UAMH 10762]EMC98037.1 hypothetical protein BAUCODRAFT_67154 [Baudoinia panamericana UAMH 10762]